MQASSLVICQSLVCICDSLPEKFSPHLSTQTITTCELDSSDDTVSVCCGWIPIPKKSEMQCMQADTEAIFKEECDASIWMLYLRMLNARCCCWSVSPHEEDSLDGYLICNNSDENSDDTYSDGEDEEIFELELNRSVWFGQIHDDTHSDDTHRVNMFGLDRYMSLQQ
jgi:hypothetical protein